MKSLKQLPSCRGMQLWGRIGPKLLELSRYHKRRIFGGNGASWRCPVLVEGRRACSGPRTRSFLETWRGELFVPFRGFAAPVQAKPKPEWKATHGPRINKAIAAPFVRLVTDEGHAVVSKHEALERAMKLKLDLVEVQRTANPPVCKLMDFHREKYKQQMKDKERVKGKSELLRKGDCKEVRFTIKTEQKDLQMKADMTRRLMERGYRVKCMAMGNEDQDLGSLLSRLAALIEDVSFVESGPRVEKRQAYMIVRHAKFGPSKSKSGLKTAKVAKASTPLQASASLSSNTDAISAGPDLEVELESETETEYDVDDDGTKEFASADAEEIGSEFGDRVIWSDFNAEVRSPASDVNTECGSKEFSSSIHGDDLSDAGLFSKDVSNGSKITAIDEILAGVDKSISSESGRFKDPIRSSSNMIRSMENSLNGQIHSSGGMPQLKPPNEVFGQDHLAGTPHDSPTVGRRMHAEQNMTKTIKTLRSVNKPFREEKSVPSGLTNSHRSEPSSISADSSPQLGYGIFSASKNMASGDGSCQGGKKSRDTSSSVISGMPDSRKINVNNNKPRPETESTDVRDNGKARQGGWGIFSSDSPNSNQQRSSRDR